MLSAAIALGFTALFLSFAPRTYGDAVKIKPLIVVLSDSDEDNHEGGNAPCRTVQQDMFRVQSTANYAKVGFLIFSCMDSAVVNCKG